MEINNRKLFNRKLPSKREIYEKQQIYDSGYYSVKGKKFIGEG